MSGERVARQVRHAVALASEGSPTVLDIEGLAGFGKTHLIRSVVGSWPPGRLRRATAYEDTRNDAYGVLRQLGAEMRGLPANALSAAQAMLRAIDALEGDDPVLIVVDDLHWADPESIDALGVLLERMAGDRVLLVTAHRPSGPLHDRWVSRLQHLPSVVRIALEGLDETEVAALMHGADTDSGADPSAEASADLARALREHTGGSPLFLRSLLHEHSLDELRIFADRGELPATRDLVATMGDRISRLNADAVATLSAIAVIGGSGADAFTLRAVADVPDVDAALHTLVHDRLVVTDRTDATPRSRIFHGVVQAAVYDTIPPAIRERMHRVAAARLRSPEEQLRHRVAAANQADDGLAADLATFADALHAVGRYREAARLRRDAATCSSSASDAARHRRAADIEAIFALDFDDLEVDTDTVLIEAADRFVSGLALAAQKRFVAASDRLDTLTDEELTDFEPLDAHRARVLRAWSQVASGRSPHPALRDLARADALPDHDPAVRGFAAMARGQAEQRTAGRGSAMSLSGMLALDRAQLISGPQGVAGLAWRGAVLALTGMAEEAIGDLSLVTAGFSEGQMDFGDGLFHGLQGFSHFINGEWPRAAIMIDLSRAARTRYAAPLTASIAPLGSVVAGDVAGAGAGLRAARRLRVQGPHPAAVHAGDIVEILVLWFVGDERAQAAWLDDRVADLGDPAVWADEQVPHLWYWAQAVGAQWAGRTTEADRWIELLRAADPTPWSSAVADWLALRVDGSPGAIARLHRLADAGLPGMPTLTALLRCDAVRASPKVQTRLRAAVAALTALGAEHLASVLSASSGPAAGELPQPSPLAGLSDREREVAALVLEGLSYAQVAQELFISRSTVSFHLSRIYAKTGTTTRHEFTAAVRGVSD